MLALFCCAMRLLKVVVCMSRGGARNRSGPQPDPLSGRSDARGFSLQALPNEGFRGDVPEFPLPFPDVEGIGVRERQIWVEAWSFPQAAAWALEPWRWPVVAEYCRLKATVESNPAANASLVAQLHRFRDQIGLTPAGLKENGWAIAPVEVGPVVVSAPVEGGEVKRRLRAVNE
ncbi:hypothetical protein [Timonella senegalensis]|uniref:hypothetical protein n=1 Tax=Timonella senegalensis TaxID=1465825 RepID=UPI002FDD839B